LGSKSQPAPSGKPSASFANIGSIGGSSGNFAAPFAALAVDARAFAIRVVGPRARMGARLHARIMKRGSGDGNPARVASVYGDPVGPAKNREGRVVRRACLACRAGFAGRGTPLARATKRSMLASGPDPRRSLGSEF